MMLAPFQALNFTGMGGPMGVYEPYDTDACDSSGMHCTAMDNEAFYATPGLPLFYSLNELVRAFFLPAICRAPTWSSENSTLVCCAER
jgi:hypothetical protein